MKRLFVIMLVLLTLLVGCGVSSDKLPSDFEMEFISDLNGNIKITNPNQPELADKVSEIALTLFSDGSFEINDKTENNKWNGTYTIEKMDSSWKLEFSLEESDEIINGVLGFREYQDKKQIYSITFNTEKNIISFIAQQ